MEALIVLLAVIGVCVLGAVYGADSRPADHRRNHTHRPNL